MLTGNTSVVKKINLKHTVENRGNGLGVERVFNESDITRDYFDSSGIEKYASKQVVSK